VNRTIRRLAIASLAVAIVIGHSAIAVADTEETGARVVLVGNAAKSEQLRVVLSELLGRRGVAIDYEELPRFSPNELLSESDDPRVWVFVSEPTPRLAKLYFRGPSGKKFLLRRLALKNGLDELGRELIGQVVDTSADALARSNVGVSREEARADMTEEFSADEAVNAASSPEASGVDQRNPPSEHAGPARLGLDVGARGAIKYSGSDLGVDHALGLETAFAFRFESSMFLRLRFVFEHGFGQGIETGSLDAKVRTTALRAGIDTGLTSGVSTWSVGVLGGADFRDIAPTASTDPNLALAEATSSTIPVIRAETRYELALGAFVMTAGLFADASLSSTSYDVQNATGVHTIARPWRVSPGGALTLGFRKKW